MLFQEQPSKEWRKHDFLLLEALQIMEQERCGQCGLPRWMCHDETGNVQFSIEEDECVVKRDIDKKNEEAAEKKSKNHGISLTPSPYFVNGASWVDARDAYYKAVSARLKEQAEMRAEEDGG